MKCCQVEEVGETDVVCIARNDAQLEGLMTVFHTERSANSLSNLQNDLPALNSDDKAAIKELAKEFEIDFVSLSFTRHASDIDYTRDFLKSTGLEGTKVLTASQICPQYLACANSLSERSLQGQKLGKSQLLHEASKVPRF